MNPDTIYKWISRKRMPAHKVGKLWKFMATEVDQWVKGGEAAQKTKGKGAAPSDVKKSKDGKQSQI